METLFHGENIEQLELALKQLQRVYVQSPAFELIQQIIEDAQNETVTVQLKSPGGAVFCPIISPPPKPSDLSELDQLVRYVRKKCFDIEEEVSPLPPCASIWENMFLLHETLTLPGARPQVKGDKESLPKSESEKVELGPGEAGEKKRYLNTFFAEVDGDSPISPDRPLSYGKPYNLHVDVDPDPHGLGVPGRPFPDKAVRRCFKDRETIQITVAVTSRDFRVSLKTQSLDLPKDGPSAEVKFRVTPLQPGRFGFLRVDCLYEGNLLQSKQVEAYVIPAGTKTAPNLARPLLNARVVFTTSQQIEPGSLRQLPGRMFTIQVDSSPEDGQVHLHFLDRTRGSEEVAAYETRINKDQYDRVLAGPRAQLREVVVKEVPKGAELRGYRLCITDDGVLLSYWLPKLANSGRYLWRALSPHIPGRTLDEVQWDEPADSIKLRPGTVIQVNPIRGRMTIPWALIYERKVKYVEDRTVVCREFETCGPDRDDCRHTEDPYVICPYAFWGYRYCIEQIPCWVGEDERPPPELTRFILNEDPLHLNFNVYARFKLWKNHVSKLEIAGNVKVLTATGITAMQDIWEGYSDLLDVVYFYCEGDINETQGQPRLQIEPRGFVDSNFMEACALRWPHRPLVFLNGCATGDYGPQTFISLIEEFRNAQASAVIGTECSMSENFAEAFAAELFPLLFQGNMLGQAMLDVRLKFLREHRNPLGLAYSLYATHEVGLRMPVAKKTEGGSQ